MNALSRRRLEWLIRARGTDLAGWPERERTAAIALLRRSPEARQLLADALVVDDAPETDCAVLSRMQAALRRSLAPLPFLLRGLRAGALLACVAAGFYFATVIPDAEPQADVFAMAQTVTFASDQ